MTSMDVDEKRDPSGGGEQKQSDTATLNYPDFDVTRMAQDYQGRIRIDRLLDVASRNPPVAEQAYALAAEQVRQGKDTNLYERVILGAQNQCGADNPVFRLDVEWQQRQQNENEKKMRQLDDEITRWRNLSNRDKICNAYIEAANFCLEIGNYTGALSKFIEAKSYASTTSALLDLNLNIVKTSILINTFTHVKSEGHHALTSDEIHGNELKRAKFVAALGLYYVRMGRYQNAADFFCDTPWILNGEFPEIISARDIGLYGGLCALAQFSREELRRRVLDNSEFKQYLQLVPLVGQLVRGFYDSEYGGLMANLNLLKVDLELDYYLHSRVDSILSAIRGKALVQYFSPYSSMDLNKMASAFNVSVEEMERELSTCIGDNHIAAKIDSHSKIVYASTTNKRRELLKQVMTLGDDFLRDNKALLMRVSLQAENVIVSRQERMADLVEDEQDDDKMGGGLMGMMGGIGKRFGPGQGGMRGGGMKQRKRKR